MTDSRENVEYYTRQVLRNESKSDIRVLQMAVCAKEDKRWVRGKMKVFNKSSIYQPFIIYIYIYIIYQ